MGVIPHLFFVWERMNMESTDKYLSLDEIQNEKCPLELKLLAAINRESFLSWHKDGTLNDITSHINDEITTRILGSKELSIIKNISFEQVGDTEISKISWDIQASHFVETTLKSKMTTRMVDMDDVDFEVILKDDSGDNLPLGECLYSDIVARLGLAHWLNIQSLKFSQQLDQFEKTIMKMKSADVDETTKDH